MAKHLWGTRLFKWEAVPANGASRGLLTMWDATKVGQIDILEGEFSLSIVFRNVFGNTIWVHTNVYGLVDHKEKHSYWQELAAGGKMVRMELSMVCLR